MGSVMLILIGVAFGLVAGAAFERSRALDLKSRQFLAAYQAGREEERRQRAKYPYTDGR